MVEMEHFFSLVPKGQAAGRQLSLSDSLLSCMKFSQRQISFYGMWNVHGGMRRRQSLDYVHVECRIDNVGKCEKEKK